MISDGRLSKLITVKKGDSYETIMIEQAGPISYIETTSLKKIFGGELHTYSSLLDRARREALLRLKESCSDADMLINLRFETSTISSGGNSNIGSVEVLAYGTALWYSSRSQHGHPVSLEA